MSSQWFLPLCSLSICFRSMSQRSSTGHPGLTRAMSRLSASCFSCSASATSRCNSWLLARPAAPLADDGVRPRAPLAGRLVTLLPLLPLRRGATTVAVGYRYAGWSSAAVDACSSWRWR